MVIKKTDADAELSENFFFDAVYPVPTYFSSNRGSLVARGVIVAE